MLPRSYYCTVLSLKHVALLLLVSFIFAYGELKAVTASSHGLVLEILQKSSNKHLEKLKSLEILAQDYAVANEAARKDLPELYRLVYEALVVRDTDAVLELAYACVGLNNLIPQDKVLALDIISSHLSNGKAYALKEFLLKRSVLGAQAFLDLADTPRSKAIAYMALADAYYATNNKPKAILFATLSLAHDFSDVREAQAKYYLAGKRDAEISLKGSQNEVLARLNEAMEDIMDPNTFRRYFSMATIIGLLPSYPLSYSSEKEENDPLNLCMAFDDRFAPHGAVTILSTLLSAKPNTKYTFHILEDVESPLDSDYKNRLCDFVNEVDSGRFEVSFVPVDKEQLPPLFQGIKKFRKWPRLVLFKLYIPDTFAELDRILWLDADLIVKEDLSVLYNTPLEGKWFAGVRDYGGDEIQSYLPLPERAAYLNVGVLLYNISAIQQANGCDRVLEYCKHNPGFEKILKYPEQDMIALIYPNEILELEHQKPIHLPDGTIQNPRWNWFYMMDNDTHWKKVHDHSSGIIHMAGGGLKPWRRKFSPTLWSWVPKRNDGVQSLYWALRDMGPWTTRN